MRCWEATSVCMGQVRPGKQVLSRAGCMAPTGRNMLRSVNADLERIISELPTVRHEKWGSGVCRGCAISVKPATTISLSSFAMLMVRCLAYAIVHQRLRERFFFISMP